MAYDTVPRSRLWDKLAKMGVGPNMLGSIQALYADVQMCVRRADGYTASFQSQLGLKQGCPLSPTLFGLYIDDLEGIWLAAGHLDLPLLGLDSMPPLLYADDLVLLSTTAAGLQRQLNLLRNYAGKWGLTVNLLKTVAVVFRDKEEKVPDRWNFASSAVPMADSFVYLGTEFSAFTGAGAAPGHRATVAQRTMHLMRFRASQLGVTAPAALCELFDSLVRPGLEWGAEIWAPQNAHSWWCVGSGR